MPITNLRNTITELKRSNVFIMKSDKGNNTVIIDQPSYDKNLFNLLNSNTYQHLNSNPTNTLVKNLKSAIDSCTSLSDPVKKRLCPSAHNLASFYALPKTHKDPITYRPIVSKTNSLTHPCAKFVSSKIKTLTSYNSFTVNNSTSFVKLIQSFPLNHNDILVSFDVTSLYTSVPVDKAITILKNKLQAHSKFNINEQQDILKLTDLCTNSTYFKFRDKFYKQSEGLAI